MEEVRVNSRIVLQTFILVECDDMCLSTFFMESVLLECMLIFTSIKLLRKKRYILSYIGWLYTHNKKRTGLALERWSTMHKGVPLQKTLEDPALGLQ